MSRSYAMTGMPSPMALVTDGSTATSSWASTTRTLAPPEIRLSMLVAWVSADDLASFEMYFPPPSSMAFLSAGSSHLAQRSSW